MPSISPCICGKTCRSPAIPLTHIAATLPRADTRDLLLVKRDWLDGRDRNELRVLSSSARRRTNLSGFLQWALPTKPPRVTFVLARGDCEARLAQLMDGDVAALVVAKANIDRLLESTGRRIRRHSHARACRCSTPAKSWCCRSR